MSQTPVVVDDRDSSIVYSDGWQQVTSNAEYRLTKTGASNAGQTASFTFTGTSVEVYGAQGSYDVYGVPVSTYSIDGNVVATHTAPMIEPGFYTSQTLFFKSDTLSASQHELVITNVNGTNPSVFWLDFIRYTPATQVPTTSQAQQPTITTNPQPTSTLQTTQQQQSTTVQAIPTYSNPPQGSSSESATSAGLITGGTSSALEQLTTLSSTTTIVTTTGSQVVTLVSAVPVASATSVESSPTAIAAASTSSSSRKTNVGPIVGGVLGGVVLLLALMFIIFRCLRSRHSSPNGNITPFGSWRDIMPRMREKPTPEPIVTSSYADLGAIPALGRSASSHTLSVTPSPPESPYAIGKLSRRPTEQSISTSPAPVPVLRDHEDSGLRIASSAVIDVPPAYTQV